MTDELCEELSFPTLLTTGTFGFNANRDIPLSMTGFLSLCSNPPRAKFSQEVYCTIESWGDTHKKVSV